MLTAQPVIAEFMAANDGILLDEDGDKSDWIELLNTGDEPANLRGWYLTDNPQTLAKWQLPAVELKPGESTIIFASGKNRDDFGFNLHTDFKLSTLGEYLALVEPDGITITHEYSLAYPTQVEGVSYGLPTTSKETQLLTNGAVARVHIPTSSAIDPISQDTIAGSWLHPRFNDTAWTQANTGIGFDTMTGGTTKVADSITDWSTNGTQGQNHWTYGYYNRTNDSDKAYSASDFRAFPDNYFAGVIWDWRGGNPPFTLIGQQNIQPNGSDDGDEHWAIRRYVSEVGGLLEIDWAFRKNNLALGGNGVTGMVLHNGVEVDSVVLGGDDNTGTSRTVVVPNVAIGDTIDFAVSATGDDGVSNGESDSSRLTATISQVTGIDSSIHANGDIENAMRNVSSSAYVRIPFQVADPSSLSTLSLSMKYDDGFVAYLNGFPVASRNVDEGEFRFDATANSDRNAAQANQTEEFSLTNDIDLLVAGENFLMIHGVNSSVNNGDFLIAPSLTATTISVALDQARYFTTPTPGEINGLGETEIGPLFLHHSFITTTPRDDLMPRTTDEIIVTTEVTKSFHDVANVALHYRTMFGSTRSLAMQDNGLGIDVIAGDGVFTASIPRGSADAGEMVRWYITATDSQANESRLPAFEQPTDSAEYFGTVIYDPSVESSNVPILHWFVRSPTSANSDRGTRGSLFYNGELYDNIQFDIHGQSTRGSGFPKKSYDVDFNRDHRFKWKDGVGRMKDINLLTNYADKGKFRNTLSYEVWGLAGGQTHLAEPVRVQQNGEFFALYDMVEDGDDRYLERLGLDPEGALYKAYNSLSQASGNQKLTRKDENFADLQALIDGAGLSGELRKRFLFDSIDIPSTVNFLAAMVVNANIDCCHKNYYIYRDTNGTGEWTFLPWDADLSFGRLWTSSKNYFDDIIKVDTAVPYGYNSVTQALLNIPEFREMYFRRVRTLMDSYLQPPGTPTSELYFESRLDDFLELLDPTNDNPATGSDDADLDFQKWGTWGNNFTMRQEIASVKNNFLPQRRAFLYNTRTIGNGGEIPGNTAFSFEGFVDENSTVSALVPTQSIGSSWRNIVFDDSDWLEGISGVGFETTSGYQDYLGIDLLSEEISADKRIDRDGDNRPDHSTVYTRYEFQLDAVPDWDSLTLQMRLDDGFVAYLNGVEIMRQNFTGTPNWNSRADGNGAEATSTYSNFDVTEHMDLLRVGDNVLAIQGLNQSNTSSDMLIQARLGATVEITGTVALDFGRFDYNPIGGNQDQEFVEIVNRGSLAVDLTGFKLRGGIDHDFAPGTVIPAEGSIFLTPDVVAFRSRSSGPSGEQGLFVQGGYSGHLSNFGETLRLIDDTDFAVAEFSYTGEPNEVQRALRISEVMYNPLGPSAAELAVNSELDSDLFEYVEVVNTSGNSLDLNGVRFSEGIEFNFANSRVTTLAPGARALVVRDQDAFETRYGTSVSNRIAGEFANLSRLDNGGETVKIEDSTNSTVVEFRYSDNVDEGWPARVDGRGSSLQIVDPSADPQDPANWRPSTLIHGSPGGAAVAVENQVIINEILTHTDLPQVDTVELLNRTDSVINLDSYYLSDSSNSIDAFAKFAIRGTMAGRGINVFDENDFNRTGGASPNDFAFDAAHGDELYLTRGTNGPTHFVDFVQFGAAANGEPFVRLDDGNLAPARQTTFGTANDAPRPGDIVFTEIQYNPSAPSEAALAIDPNLIADDLEFIEIFSRTTHDLTNWRIRNGVDFDFAPGTTLNTGEVLVVVPFNPDRADNANRLAAFRVHYSMDANARIIGGYSGQLGNGGERIELQRPDTPPTEEPNFIPRLTEESVRYDDRAPWPVAADQIGQSLTRRSIDVYAGFASSWSAANPTPGQRFVVELRGDFNDDGLENVEDIDLLSVATILNDPAFDLTGDGVTNSDDVKYLVVEILGTSIGDSNFDGVFDSGDLVEVFKAGEYQDNATRNSTWMEGDWNGDREFDTSDLVFAFQAGGFLAASISIPESPDALGTARIDNVRAVDQAFSNRRDSLFLP